MPGVETQTRAGNSGADTALDYAKRSLSFAQANGNSEYEGVAVRLLGRIGVRRRRTCGK